MTAKDIIAPHVTFGVNCTGNVQALSMCLMSVLAGEIVPSAITVRMEGALPAFGNFYLEQAASFAAMKGVAFRIDYAQSRGVRHARDWQMRECRTQFLWMGDDDCFYTHHCLARLLEGLGFATEDFRYTDEEGNACDIGYINGTKPDINNRRQYGDFSTKVLDTFTIKNGASMNQFYEGSAVIVGTKTMDTGNVLLNLPALATRNLWFSKFEQSFNSGGEDTLMGLHCHKERAYGYFSPLALAIHLEKPVINFNEFAARGEMLLRACERLGIDKAGLKEFMPWLQAN